MAPEHRPLLQESARDVPLLYCPTCNTGYAYTAPARCPYCHSNEMPEFVRRMDRQAWGRRKRSARAVVVPGPYVNVDTKYRDGMAALAVVGAIGTHSKVVPCRASFDGEVKALEFAMEIAAEQRVDQVTFRTDCTSAAHPSKRTIRSAELMRAHPSWRVVVVPRRQNVAAHGVAAKAWRAAGLR